jgi:anaerobic ribonucleoside-triphosphate reductase activating protein
MQSEEVLIDLLQLVHDVKVKFPNKTIWVYTGYYKDELNDAQRHILDYCDCIVEGPFEIEKRDTTLPFRGSSNQRITKLN